MRSLLVIAAAASMTACAAIAGLKDYELAGDASVGSAADGGTCGVCPTGYGCVHGECGNVVKEVAASSTHACAALLGGELWCWGKSQLGNLGVEASSTPDVCGTVACRPTPGKVPGLTDVQHVALSDDMTCTLDSAGAVRCFGSNARAQLGHDPSTDPSCGTTATAGDAQAPSTQPCSSTPRLVTIDNGANVAQIAAGANVACARTATDGKVYCWGDDYFAEDGVFPIPTTGYVSSPTFIAGTGTPQGGPGTIAFSGSFGHGCQIGLLNDIACWGANLEGELGHTGADAGGESCVFAVGCDPKASTFPGLSGIVVASGEKATCAVKGGGNVWCWGANDAAQLGNGESVDSASHPVPQTVVGLSNVVALELRFETGFAIDGTAKVWAWGYASDGALGVVASSVACAPGLCVPLAVRVPALDGAVQIASTKAGGVALKSDGSVWTWGINDLGQLGHASSSDPACDDGPCETTPALLVGLP